MPHDHACLSNLDSIASLLPAFDFEGLISRGAAGAVYKARQRSLDRDVAIRIASRESAEDPAFRNSYENMAKVMASLAHPGLIRVFDSGEVDGLPFVVMEYVPGSSLRQSAHGRAVEPRQAVQIVRAACQGLAQAHGKGIAHGAIRPANILLTQKCEPKIGNFGLAHEGPHDADDSAAYLAPELSDGSRSGNPQADVYAIGVILQELLTGIPAGTVDQSPLALPDPKLAAICQKAAHSDPARRYPDAGTLAEALGQWLVSRAPLRTPLQRQTSAQRPKSAAVAKPPTVSYPSSRAGRGMLIHCTVIAALLLAIHGVWGAYQTKKDTLARLRNLEDAKPRVIVIEAEPVQETSHGIDPSIVQFKP